MMPLESQVDSLPPEPQVDSLPQQQKPYNPPLLEAQEQYVLVTGLSI